MEGGTQEGGIRVVEADATSREGGAGDVLGMTGTDGTSELGGNKAGLRPVGTGGADSAFLLR